MPIRKKSPQQANTIDATDKGKEKKTRKVYGAAFKHQAVKMITPTSPCAVVARHLGLPAQTLNNWHNAYRRESVHFADRLHLTLREKEWVLDQAEKRLTILGKRGNEDSNMDEIALLQRLKVKILRR